MPTYIYENSDPERFQMLVQALFLPEYPNLQCFPVGQADGGRDATSVDPATGGLTVVQIKFKRKDESIDDSAAWLIEALKGEKSKIERLAERGATTYIIVTNARGTAALGGGGMDRVAAWMAENLPIQATCYWRDDLDRRLDGNASLRLVHPEILTGADAVQLALGALLQETRDRQGRAIKSFLAYQYERDATVKFKQIDLRNDLLSLFIDVPVTSKVNFQIVKDGRSIATWRHDPLFEADNDHFEAFRATTDWELDGAVNVRPVRSKVGAATLLLAGRRGGRSGRTVLEGGPGQGKSTLAQYVCQVHRARLLSRNAFVSQLPLQHQHSSVRFPVKVDLRDLATWLSGREPFLPEQPLVAAAVWQPTLEAYLAHQISHQAGGTSFTVDDLIDIAARMPTLLFLDGLDEVADITARASLIKAVREGIERLEENSQSLQVIVTSRPSAFENSPGFSSRDFAYLELQNLNEQLVRQYSEKWIAARELDDSDAFDVRRILSEKLSLPHIRDLARNPMQLAILLTLVHSIGYSLPDQRTELYSTYMDKFLTREAEKSPSVRKYRDLLVRIHQYLAWMLQTEAETTAGASGSISPQRLRQVMRDFLDENDHPLHIIDDLFTGALERVYVLVQRVEGAYEFEVQPIREFFCARYLYETAAVTDVPQAASRGTRPRRFDVMARNPYWTNVTRFYAGSYTSGEIASLYMQLEEYGEDGDNALAFRPRQLGATLLSDWAFKNTPRAVKKVVDCTFDDLGIRGAAHGFDGSRQASPIALPFDAGRVELQRLLMAKLEDEPADAWSGDLVTLLLVNSSPSVREWAFSMMARSVGEQLDTWVDIALRLHAFGDMSGDDLDGLVTHDAPEAHHLRRRAYSFLVHQAEAISNSATLTGVAVQLALEGQAVSVWGTSTWVGRLATLLDCSYSVWRVQHSLANSHAVAQLSREVSWVTPPAERSTEVAFLEATRGVPDGITEPGDWTTTLALWDALIEPLRASYGDVWTAYRLSNIAAGITSPSERGQGLSALFDASISLAGRARYARHRSGQAAWWSKQYEYARTDHDRQFWCLLLFTWGSPASIAKLAETVTQAVEALPVTEYTQLITALEADSEVSNRRLSTQSEPPACLLGSPRGLTAYMVRYQLSTKRSDLFSIAKMEPSVADWVEHRTAVDRFTDLTECSSEEALQCIRDLYQSRHGRGVVDRPRYGREALRPNLEASKAILSEPKQYPFDLLEVAARVVQASLHPPAVGEVAKSDGWTFE